MDQIQESIEHWRALAEEQRTRPTWDRYACAQACAARAETYERTARSLELQRDTGMPHCACCLKPTGTKDAHR